MTKRLCTVTLAMSLAGIAATATFAALPAHAGTVDFIPGSYQLSYTFLGPTVDTLVVTTGGGMASFAISGPDSETFSVPDDSTPTGLFNTRDPYYSIGGAVTASWSAAQYPIITFWTTTDIGGVTAGTIPGDSGTNLFNLFPAAAQGNFQVFSISGSVPEPATWAMMIIGLGGLGVVMRGRRRKVVTA